MKIRYSSIREKFKIDPQKVSNEDLAIFTHYLQTATNGSAHYFRKEALRFTLEQDPSFNLSQFADIKWDVPFPAPKNPKFKFIDLFAGIGGFRMAFQNLGGKCVFTSELNNFAKKTYEANFGEVPFGDITKINEKDIPDHDILLGGFPCQPFSIAGVSKKKSLGREHGFKDKTQGTLFFDIMRILDEKKPKVFLLENVKNLVSHDKGNTFRIIREALSVDYNIHFRILDGDHFVPQHRERIFIVGFRKKVFHSKENFQFPKLPDPSTTMEDILERAVDKKYTLSDHLWRYLQEYARKHKEKGNGFGYGLIDLDGISRTMSARYYKDGAEILIPQNGSPRRLTPRECARLQGYPDTFVIPVSDNQAYRQFGNSVVMPLVQAIGKEITKVLTKGPANGKHSAKGNRVSTKKPARVL